MSTMDVENMKVADLKRELKARNLATTGVKTELVERLRAVIDQEPGKDNESQEGGVNAEDDIGTLSDCDEGELLNEDDLLHDKPVETVVKAAEKPQNIPKTVKTISALQKEGILQPMEDDIFSDTPKEIPQELSLEERKALRAKKFNLEPTPSEKLEMRAKKFGEIGGPEDAPSKKSQKIGETPEVDKEKLLQRAKRFGLEVGEDGKAIVKPKAAVPPPAKKEVKLNIGMDIDPEVLKRRAERFGQNVSKVGQKIEEDEKLMKRKLKFGIAIAAAASAGSGEGGDEGKTDEPAVKQARKPIVF